LFKRYDFEFTNKFAIYLREKKIKKIKKKKKAFSKMNPPEEIFYNTDSKKQIKYWIPKVCRKVYSNHDDNFSHFLYSFCFEKS
jgi:hypothetical protein